jgi:predicted nuclease of predicted toxin-antitoxin system
MSFARLYANENFPRRVIELLRQLGYDVLTVREAGLDNQRINDEAVLAFAIAERRALYQLIDGISSDFTDNILFITVLLSALKTLILKGTVSVFT